MGSRTKSAGNDTIKNEGIDPKPANRPELKKEKKQIEVD